MKKNTTLIRHPSKGIAPFWELLRRERGRLMITYWLFALECAAALLEPLIMGWAISAVLSGQPKRVVLYFTFGIFVIALGTIRRMLDTRLWCRFYANLMLRVHKNQRLAGVHVSGVAARSRLAQDLVSFLERDLPIFCMACIQSIGALMVLARYDPWLATIALGITSSGFVFCRCVARQANATAQLLHNALEDEVIILSAAETHRAEHHYFQTARSRIQLSDLEAFAYTSTQGLSFLLVASVLVRANCYGGMQMGNLYAMIRYASMFTGCIATIPVLIPQVARLKDIYRRLSITAPPVNPSNQTTELPGVHSNVPFDPQHPLTHRCGA